MDDAAVKAVSESDNANNIFATPYDYLINVGLVGRFLKNRVWGKYPGCQDIKEAKYFPRSHPNPSRAYKEYRAPLWKSRY